MAIQVPGDFGGPSAVAVARRRDQSKHVAVKVHFADPHERWLAKLLAVAVCGAAAGLGLRRSALPQVDAEHQEPSDRQELALPTPPR